MTASLLDDVGQVHPHHVDTIRDHAASLEVGSVVRILDAARSRFYTGLLDGDRAILTNAPLGDNFSAQALDGEGASLLLPREHFEPVDPAEWTREEFEAAERVAGLAASALLEDAFTHANGWNFGRTLFVDEGRAVECLKRAGALRRFAFAAGVTARFNR